MLEFPSCAFMRRAMSSLDGVAGCAAACLALTVCAAAHAGAKSWSIDSAAHQTSSRHAFLVRSRSVSSLTAAASVGRIATTLVTSTPAFDIPTGTLALPAVWAPTPFDQVTIVGDNNDDVDVPVIMASSNGGDPGMPFLQVLGGGLDMGTFDHPGMIDPPSEEGIQEPVIVVPLPTPALLAAIGAVGAIALRRRVLRGGVGR